MNTAKALTPLASVNVTCKYCDKHVRRENFARHLQRQHEDVYRERKRHSTNGIYKPKIGEDFTNQSHERNLQPHYVKKPASASKYEMEQAATKMNGSTSKMFLAAETPQRSDYS